MKTSFLLFLITCIGLSACTNEMKAPLEGKWEPVKIEWSFLDSTFIKYPGNVSFCEGLLFFLNNNYSYSVNYIIPPDTIVNLDFSAGEYRFNGKTYYQTWKYSTNKKFVGQSFTFEMNIKNDTLTLIGPQKGEENRLGCWVYEVWVRKK